MRSLFFVLFLILVFSVKFIEGQDSARNRDEESNEKGRRVDTVSER